MSDPDSVCLGSRSKGWIMDERTHWRMDEWMDDRMDEELGINCNGWIRMSKRTRIKHCFHLDSNQQIWCRCYIVLQAWDMSSRVPLPFFFCCGDNIFCRWLSTPKPKKCQFLAKYFNKMSQSLIFFQNQKKVRDFLIGKFDFWVSKLIIL